MLVDKKSLLFLDGTQIDWEEQLRYGEEIGLGSRQYELIPLEARS